MSEHNELKSFLRASEGVLPEDEKDRIARDCPTGDGPGEYTELKAGLSEHMSENLKPDQITGFLDFISKKGEQHPSYLVDLGNLLREFGSKSGEARVLNDKEQQVVSLGIRYIEQWMYEAGPLESPDYKERFPGVDSHEYLAVAAFLINQLAKIKERPEHSEVYSHDAEKLQSFFAEVDKFNAEFFNPDNLRKQADTLGERETQLNQDFGKLETETEGPAIKLREIIQEANVAFEKFLDAEAVTPPLPQDIKVLLYQCQSPLVVRSMLESDLTLAEAMRRIAPLNDEVTSVLKFLNSKTDSLRSGLPKTQATLAVVEKVRNFKLAEFVKRYKEEESTLKKVQIAQDAINQSRMALYHERDILNYLLSDRDFLENITRVAGVFVKKGVDRNPAGFLYFLKNIVIASEIINRNKELSGSESIDVRIPRTEQDGAEHIFDFEDSEKSKAERKSYRRVHFKRSWLPYALMSAYFLRQKQQKAP